MNRLLTYLVLSSLCGSAIAAAPQRNPGRDGTDEVRVYEVNKMVTDFPAEEDMSTPESAYATLNRLSASGERAFWRRLSIRRVARRFPRNAKKRKVSERAAYERLNANILEVRIFKGKHAQVFAKSPHPVKTVIDIRSLELERGRWLNVGNDVVSSLGAARKKFQERCLYVTNTPLKRKPVKDTQSHLRPFIEFLRTDGREPKGFTLEALKRHKVVIMGEIHHRPRYWNFNASLVADPEFPKSVGTIYMELPSHDQELVEKFLGAKECDTSPIIEMLRDNLWMGWPDKPMLDFFVTVWEVNRGLPLAQRLRIVLVDMPRPWKDIRKREDWKKYDVNRDRFMAENILRDIEAHPQDKRNVLFIVGAGHTMLDLKGMTNKPVKSAGWCLREKLGRENVYAFFPHTARMTNMGRVDGRLCLGLFESAFAALKNKPVAFPLTEGPFGEQRFDAFPDRPVSNTYGDGYDAYLYLGPLEGEIFSPLIPGFYTDEFVKELDRRYRIMFRKALVQGCRLKRLNAESFIGWMSNSWGQPRRRWKKESLGPLNAWSYGDDWEKVISAEKQRSAMKEPEVIRDAARDLFESIRRIDYDKYGYANWRECPFEYRTLKWYDQLVVWICTTFKSNPIKQVKLGKVFENGRGSPTVPYKLTLRDGRILSGDLPFYYSARPDRWIGERGIDWHLKYPGDLPKSKSSTRKRIPKVRTRKDASERNSSPPASTEAKPSALVDRSSPEATVTSWTRAVATGRREDALACMLPGGVDYDDIKQILDADSSTPGTLTMRKLFEAIDPERSPKSVKKLQLSSEVLVAWKVVFKHEVTMRRGTKFKPGDTFDMDATLKKKGDHWLIDNI